jgi:hypothetical protein
MKKLNFVLCIFIGTLTVISVFSCNRLQMSNEEARTLIVAALKLPQTFRHDVNGESILNTDRDQLANAGFITKEGGAWASYTITPTETGKPFYLGIMGQTPAGSNILGFKTYDIDVDQISGVSINKDDQTAMVRFSLKAINITPIGTLLEPNVNSPKNGELVFKKFDNGWQLNSDQNTPPIDLLKRFL